MNPKMTIFDAAQCLGLSQTLAYSRLLDNDLSAMNFNNHLYFEHRVAARFFQFNFRPKIMVFQILKGGTGKTSLAFEFAVRASLYGAEVLCIDLDSQGNLTQAFKQDAEEVPVMVDHLAEGYPIFDSLLRVMDGLDILPSRIENAMLDEVIRSKNVPLDQIYRDPFTTLKSFYDLIVVDCPPSLGQSVAAAALASDVLITPLTPDKFALNGLETTLHTMQELQDDFGIKLQICSVLNKFEPGNSRSQDVWRALKEDPRFHNILLSNVVRLSQDFPAALSLSSSIFDKVESCEAKEDVDALTRGLLGIKPLEFASGFECNMLAEIENNDDKPEENNTLDPTHATEPAY
jgi:chromosome partitioning protein